MSFLVARMSSTAEPCFIDVYKRQALGPVGIALAFGLSIVAMAFVIGNVSGCHINPAVSLGLFMDKRLSGKDLIGYWVAQFVGGIVAAAVLALIISLCDLGGVAATGLGLSLIHI